MSAEILFIQQSRIFTVISYSYQITDLQVYESVECVPRNTWFSCF